MSVTPGDSLMLLIILFLVLYYNYFMAAALSSNSQNLSHSPSHLMTLLFIEEHETIQ